MQQEDDLRALEKIVRFARTLGIVFPELNRYWSCYNWFAYYSLTASVAGRDFKNLSMYGQSKLGAMPTTVRSLSEINRLIVKGILSDSLRLLSLGISGGKRIFRIFEVSSKRTHEILHIAYRCFIRVYVLRGKPESIEQIGCGSRINVRPSRTGSVHIEILGC
ncbi:hypothetical protein B5F90_09720 [Alistipes sp. An31A]|nr:hypothetical protein B5F90_09720 [Alistipes sp. An31A]